MTTLNPQWLPAGQSRWFDVYGPYVLKMFATRTGYRYEIWYYEECVLDTVSERYFLQKAAMSVCRLIDIGGVSPAVAA